MHACMHAHDYTSVETMHAGGTSAFIPASTFAEQGGSSGINPNEEVSDLRQAMLTARHHGAECFGMIARTTCVGSRQSCNHAHKSSLP
jgi:hypothetical protein